ncbi:MAG: DUF1036 domain-containing protein [Xanthobacteraceae bacterium]
MDLARSGLTSLLFALAGLCAGAASAQAQTFNLQVCNHSSVSASVATSGLAAVGSDQFVVEGWWTVGAGNCLSLGNFPQGWFYLYAEQTNSGQYVWSGTDLNLCVQYPGPFNRINTTDFTCGANELKGFSAVLIPSTTGTFTWNLN